MYLIVIFLIISSLFILFYYVRAKKIEGRSLRSKIIQDILSIHRIAVLIGLLPNVDKIKKEFEKRKSVDIKPYSWPKKLKIKTTVEAHKLEGMNYYILNKNGSCSTKILYFHGGGYAYGLFNAQIKMMDKIATILDAEIIIPDYPLLPFSNHKEAYRRSLALYKNIIKNVSSENIIIMGDSAGGGLSLGLTLLLKEKQLPIPGQVILLSPWLDITMSNPEITADLNRKDVMCNLDTLIYLGKLWADDENQNNYQLSPIKGDLTDLPRISIFVGTRELFLPDAKLLHKSLVELGNQGKLYIYHEMIHVFQVLPIPEAEKSIREIIRIMKST